MKITFNILSQKHAPNAPYAALIKALQDLPHTSYPTEVPAGFARWKMDEKYVNVACNFLGLSYFTVIKSVVQMCLDAHVAELNSHNKTISDLLEVPIYVKANEAILTTPLPVAFELSSYNAAEPGQQEDIQQYTISQWLDQHTVINNRGNGKVDFSLIKNTSYLNLANMKALFDWVDAAPLLGIELMTGEEYSTYQSTFNQLP